MRRRNATSLGAVRADPHAADCYWIESKSRPGLAHLVDTDYDGIWQCGCERSLINGTFCRHMQELREHMEAKKKYPRALALKVAADLCRELKPVCARLVVAGSLRRRKEAVGDVEIVYVPTFKSVPDGLFDTKEENQVDVVLARLLAGGVLTKRAKVTGETTWGEKNKLAVHAATGVPVDLFSTDETCYWNYLVCRTGGQENNVALATAAQEKGWKWTPYGPGFTDEHGAVVPVKSEQDVYRLVGMAYREPWERK